MNAFLPQGSTVKVLVNFFQIKLDEEEEKTLAEEIVGSSFDHIAEGVEEIVGYGGLNRLKVSRASVRVNRERIKESIWLFSHAG